MIDDAIGDSVRADILELRRHHCVLLGRLEIETNRHERIAHEDQIIAVEALIAGFVAHLECRHTAISKVVRDES